MEQKRRNQMKRIPYEYSVPRKRKGRRKSGCGWTAAAVAGGHPQQPAAPLPFTAGRGCDCICVFSAAAAAAATKTGDWLKCDGVDERGKREWRKRLPNLSQARWRTERQQAVSGDKLTEGGRTFDVQYNTTRQ